MADNVYDAIVIGSGISGGWAAKELTEKGLKTIMLERGMDIVHVKDYTEANKEAWDYPHRGDRTQQMISHDRIMLGPDLEAAVLVRDPLDHAHPVRRIDDVITLDEDLGLAQGPGREAVRHDGSAIRRR